DLTGSIPEGSRREVGYQASQTTPLGGRVGRALRGVRSERDLPAGVKLFLLVALCAGTPVSVALAVIWGSRCSWLTPIGALAGPVVGSVSLLGLLGSLWVVGRGIRMLMRWTQRSPRP